MDIRPVILVVEDDSRIRDLINKNLSDNYIVILAKNFNEGVTALKKYSIDLACLDIVLPDGNGLEICRIIKENYTDIKVIVLSKKSQIEDRLKVFNTGADDYLSKPFFFQELLVRIEKLLDTSKNSNTISKPPFKLETNRGIFTFYRNSTNLSKGQTVILKTILNSSSKYCDIESIQNAYFTYSIKRPSKEGLKVTVSRLRNKIKREWGIDLIKTRYGYGYYLSYVKVANKL